MLEVVEGVSPGEADAQLVADIVVAADIVVVADIVVAAVPVDNTAAGTADAVVLAVDTAADALAVGNGAPLSAHLFLPPPLAVSVSAVG